MPPKRISLKNMETDQIDTEIVTEISEDVKPVKTKRIRSQAQLDALAKGRAKKLENLKLKKEVVLKGGQATVKEEINKEPIKDEIPVKEEIVKEEIVKEIPKEETVVKETKPKKVSLKIPKEVKPPSQKSITMHERAKQKTEQKLNAQRAAEEHNRIESIVEERMQKKLSSLNHLNRPIPNNSYQTPRQSFHNPFTYYNRNSKHDAFLSRLASTIQ